MVDGLVPALPVGTGQSANNFTLDALAVQVRPGALLQLAGTGCEAAAENSLGASLSHRFQTAEGSTGTSPRYEEGLEPASVDSGRPAAAGEPWSLPLLLPELFPPGTYVLVVGCAHDRMGGSRPDHHTQRSG